MQTRDHLVPRFPNVRTIYSEVSLSSYECPLLKNSVAPFANESLDITSPTSVTTVPNGQMIARPVGQQAPVSAHVLVPICHADFQL